MFRVSGSQQQESKTEMLQKLQQLTESLNEMKKDTRKEDEQIRSKVNKVRIHLQGVYIDLGKTDLAKILRHLS